MSLNANWSKRRIESLSQNVLWLVWSSACATWPACGCPLQTWGTVRASFQWGQASDSVPYPAANFSQKCIGTSYRNFFPFCEGVLKLIKRFKCWGRRQKCQKLHVSTSLSLTSFVSLGNQSKRHVLISALVFLHCKFGALLQEDLIVFVIFSVVCRALGNFSSD